MTLDQMLNDLTGKIDRTRAAGRTSGTFSIDELEQLTFEVARIQAEHRDLDGDVKDHHASFELYHKASRALQKAFVKAHPEWPEGVWPDATMVNVWAAQQLGLKPEEIEDGPDSTNKDNLPSTS